MKRAMILAAASAVIGLTSAAAFAGPSDHWTQRFESRQQVRRADRDRNTPYALTGDRVQRRVQVTRDVPQGRVQTERRTFWVWQSE